MLFACLYFNIALNGGLGKLASSNFEKDVDVIFLAVLDR